MTDPRPIRLGPPDGSSPRPAAPAPRPQRPKPDPNPMRLILGLAGIASASAFVTAMLPSVTPSQVATVEAVDTMTALGPQPSVVHVTRIVTLAPGQTAPPDSAVVVQPQPTPRVRVQVVTRQSGQP